MILGLFLCLICVFRNVSLNFLLRALRLPDKQDRNKQPGMKTQAFQTYAHQLPISRQPRSTSSQDCRSAIFHNIFRGEKEVLMISCLVAYFSRSGNLRACKKFRLMFLKTQIKHKNNPRIMFLIP